MPYTLRLKKLYLVCVVLPFGAMVWGQEVEKLLHQNLDEVKVIASQQDFYQEDIRVSHIDSVLKMQNATLNLGQLLSLTAPVMVKTYGSTGALSVISLRGSAAHHTSVMWNGFPLNSLTLGLQDLSLINTGAMQNISLTYGASGSLYGSGTFGGTVNLNNTTDWKPKKSVGLNGELGSFNNQRYGIRAAMGSEKVQYILNTFYQRADNDFPYYDEYKSGTRLRRKHNKLENRTVVQNIFIKLPSSQLLEAGLWYQFKDKNLPLILGANKEPIENQKDEFLRGYLKWKRRFVRSTIAVKAGWLYDFQKYRSENDTAQYKTSRLYSDFNYRYYLSEHFVFDVGGAYNYALANVSAYDGKIDEHAASLIGALKYAVHRWVLNLSTRYQYTSNENPKPLYSLGFRHEVLPGALSFRTNFSTKYRIPTFNEKYWQPGGNPGLKPEKGWSMETGLQGKIAKGKSRELNWNVTAYYSQITNYIQWLPAVDDSGKPAGDYWTPQPSGRVVARGGEAELRYIHSFGSWKLNGNATYSYTRSTYEGNSPQKGQQLIYVPEHLGKLYLNLSYRKAWVAYQQSYNGSVFYSKNDRQALDAYLLSDFYIGKRFQIGNYSTVVQLHVQNLWDKKYTIVRSYPMPGRAYYLNFNLNFN